MATNTDILETCRRACEAIGQSDFASAAQLLESAASAHPEHPVVHTLLARSYAGAGRVEHAVTEAEKALQFDGNLRKAHELLADLLRRRGEYARALAHESVSRRAVPSVAAQFYGDGEPLRVVQLGALPVTGLTGTDGILDAAHTETTTVIVQYWDPAKPLPEHDLVWNAIADEEVHAAALDVAEWLLDGSHAPVINTPARVRGSGRLENATRFAPLDGVRYPCMERFRRDGVPTMAFPLLVRSRGEHNGRNFIYVPDLPAFRDAIAELPGDELLAIEYVETRADGDRFRKYRVMIVDGKLYPAHLAISSYWNVHYFSAQMGEAECAEERAFLADMNGALPPAVLDALYRVASALDLDYAGVDFGIAPDGTLVVFEANAVMTVFVPDATPENMYRREAALRIFEAAREMLARRVQSSR